MQQTETTNPQPGPPSRPWQANLAFFPNPNVYSPTELDLRGFLRCRMPPPPGIQDVLFYITARFADGLFHPLAIVSQVPPSADRWPPVTKAFVAGAVQRIHEHLSNLTRHAFLETEVQRAALLYRNESSGRARQLAPGEPPGVATAEDRAIWLDNAPHRHAANALLNCLANGEGSEEEYWTPLELRTRFGMLDSRYKAVVFDITDLTRVTCGVIENEVVPVLDTSASPPLQTEESRRTVWTVPQWVLAENGFENVLSIKDESADALLSTFPDIPLIDRDVLKSKCTSLHCQAFPSFLGYGLTHGRTADDM